MLLHTLKPIDVLACPQRRASTLLRYVDYLVSLVTDSQRALGSSKRKSRDNVGAFGGLVLRLCRSAIAADPKTLDSNPTTGAPSKPPNSTTSLSLAQEIDNSNGFATVLWVSFPLIQTHNCAMASKMCGITCDKMMVVEVDKVDKRPRIVALNFFYVADPQSQCRFYSAQQFMNPGPAPRPPTERPRPPLSLTPQINGYPGNGYPSANKSTASLNAPAMRSNSSFTVNNVSTPSLALTRAGTNDPLMAAGAVKQGYIKYKEEGFGALLWKTKWASLRQNTLDLSKQEGSKVSFSIVLAHVTGVQRYDAIPLCIELIRAANPAAYPGVPLREQPSKTMYMKFDGDEELYEWQDGIYTRCPAISGVSNPTNFSHRIHVGFDPKTGGFLGLPAEWERLLNGSALTKADYYKNPQAVIEVLEFYTDMNKRVDNPDQFPSLVPTPPANPSANMQLGHGGAGTSIAPPRPAPPTDRSVSYGFGQASQYDQTPPRSQGGTPMAGQRNVSGPGAYGAPQPQMSLEGDSKLNMGGDMRRIMEEEARKVREEKERKEREFQRREQEERDRREQAEYNASIPQKKIPLAQQELGGYSHGPEQPRYNPQRTAPAAPPQQQRQPPQGSLRQMQASRPAPSAPGSNTNPVSPPRAPFAQNGTSSRDQSPSSSLRAPQADQPMRQPSPASRAMDAGRERNQSPAPRGPPNGAQNGASQASRIPGPTQQQVKPLNVGKPYAGQPQQKQDAVKKPEGAKPANETKQKEVRMSTMSEAEVMVKLKQIVTRVDPNDSYVKQKKIGQGASGSVYIAKVRADATSQVGKSLYRKDGTDARVAVKTMDLRHQPRKELIVNEIIVMKESIHPNIVNYLDSFLVENDTELWVIMEYMNGGALTDVIENNPVITEDQIAAICNEVNSLRLSFSYAADRLQTCKGLGHLHSQNIIHRDIKSDNVLLDSHGRVKISKYQFAGRCGSPANIVQPTLVSAPSSPWTSPSARRWLVHRTGWPPRLSSRRSTAPKSTSGPLASWPSSLSRTSLPTSTRSLSRPSSLSPPTAHPS